MGRFIDWSILGLEYALWSCIKLIMYVTEKQKCELKRIDRICVLTKPSLSLRVTVELVSLEPGAASLYKRG